MIFTQSINIDNGLINQEFMKICVKYPGCENCPLKDGDMNIHNSVIRCETGRAKNASK